MLIDTAEAFQKDLFAARNSANGGNVLMTPASANLQSLIGALNVTMDGQYLFAGINTAVAAHDRTMRRARPTRTPSMRRSSRRSGLHRPRRRPRASPPATCRLSSIRPSRPSSTIRPGAPTGRRPSDQVMRSRISTTQTIDTSVSANEPAFRKLAMAYTMLSDLGTQNLNQAAFQTVVDKATLVIGGCHQRPCGIGRHDGYRAGADDQRNQSRSRSRPISSPIR